MKVLSTILNNWKYAMSPFQQKEHSEITMISWLYLPHSLLFVIPLVALPGGQAVHTAAAVSLAAVVW